MTKLRLLATLILMIYSTANLALVIGTHLLPPFSMREDGEDIGMVTEAVQTLLQQSGYEEIQIVQYPSARGLAELQAGRIDIFYPYIKLQNNLDADYILLGPIARYHLALFVAQNYDGEISIARMNNVLIGTDIGGVAQSLLNNTALQLELVSQQISCLKMVVAERITACAIGALPGIYLAAMNDLYDKLKYADTGLYANIYLLLSNKLPPEAITKLQQTFAKLQQENYFVQQQKDYERKFKLFVKVMT